MIGNEGHTRCPECGLIIYKDVSECPRCFALIKPMPSKPSPTVEKVYTEEISESPPKEGKDVRRIATIIIVIIIVASVVIALSYYFLIPRIELKIITVYRESSGLAINVDSKLKNEGTLNIQNFLMNITVLNSSDGVVVKGNYNLSDLDAHSSHKFDNIYFFGDQYDKYHITIAISFESSGKVYSKNFSHTVKEYMQVRFEDTYMKWGG